RGTRGHLLHREAVDERAVWTARLLPVQRACRARKGRVGDVDIVVDARLLAAPRRGRAPRHTGVDLLVDRRQTGLVVALVTEPFRPGIHVGVAEHLVVLAID